MFCYSFESPYSGAGLHGKPISVLMPKFYNQVKMIVNLVAKSREVPVVICTRFAGEKLLGENWTVSDFIRMEEDEPQVETIFDTEKDSWDKIQCIKAVRSMTGQGLKEAKEFVEAVERVKGSFRLVDFISHEYVK